MNKTYLSLALVMATLSGSLAAQTLVTVNGTKIDSSEIDLQVKNLQTQSNGQVQDNPQLRQSLLQGTVTRTLVAQEARRLKLDQSAEFKQVSDQALAQAKKEGADKAKSFKHDWAVYQNELLLQAFLANVAAQNPVTEADTQKAYNEISSYYKGSDEVQLGEIITRTTADADKAIADLKAKKIFKTVAAQYSLAPQAKENGGIATDYVPLKDLQQNAPAIYNAVSSLKKGQYTAQPVQGENGVAAVFYINDKRAIKIPSYQEMAPGLTRDMQAARVDAAIQPLYQKAKIEPSN